MKLGLESSVRGPSTRELPPDEAPTEPRLPSCLDDVPVVPFTFSCRFRCEGVMGYRCVAVYSDRIEVWMWGRYAFVREHGLSRHAVARIRRKADTVRRRRQEDDTLALSLDGGR